MTAGAWLRLAAAALFAMPMAACAAPDAVSATYSVIRAGLHIATTQESFERTGSQYRVSSDSNPVGLAALFVRKRIKVLSSGTVTPAGLHPQQFEYGDGDKSVSATFDWKSQRLHMTFDGRNETIALPQGTQDRLSLMYQFMFLPVDKVKTIPIQMTNGKKIESYLYQVTDSGSAETPLGKMNAVHLVKQRDAGDNNQIEVWLATERHFVPIKILVVESDGARYEWIITRLEFKPT